MEFVRQYSYTPYFQRTCFHSSHGVDVEKMIFKIDEWLARDFDVPPLGEQKKIASILSSVDEALKATQAVIDQLQIVKNAMMAELLTRGLPGRHTRFKQTEIGEVPEDWEVRPLEDWLSNLIDYRGKSPPKHESGTTLITAKNVRAGYIHPDPREFIPDAAYSAWMCRGVPQPGDVLFTTEAPLGNAAPVPVERIALGQRLVTLCPDRSRVDETFLLWTVLSPGFQSLLQSKATGSTVQGIKQSVLRTLPVAMPPMTEQRAIGQTVEAAEQYAATSKKEFDALRHVKSSLMSVLLTGEVRVTPDEEAA
jgi:type I restriction enzyme S subunit